LKELFVSAMTDKLGIIFMHHAADAVTLHNLASVRRCNPEAQIFTISAGAALPGGYSLNATPLLKTWHEQLPKRSGDRLLLSLFSQLRAEDVCDKWWITEWDVFCHQSVREFYGPVWSQPFVASASRFLNREPEWSWFGKLERELKKNPAGLPSGYRQHVCGIVPFISLLSHVALDAICRQLMADPIFVGNSEVRLATAAARCGYRPCIYSPPDDQITWIDWEKLPPNPKIVYPVKFIAQV
jgi:hypothetical protein